MTQQLMDNDFDSDSLELLFNNSDPSNPATENQSPIIPRAPLPRRQSSESSNDREPTTTGRGPVTYQPHVSPITGERQLPVITPVTIEPPYKLPKFQSYPNNETNITSEAIFTHIISDLGNILDTTDK